MNLPKIKTAWGSHLAILSKAALASSGDMLECGTGFFSTPILHWISLYMKRRLLSLDNSPDFLEWNKNYMKGGFHEFRLITNWRTADLSGDWGLALVDCNPLIYRRAVIRKLYDKAQIIVLHDTQQTPKAMSRYKYEEIYHLFKYRYDYRGAHPNTSVLSNFIDVKKMMEGE